MSSETSPMYVHQSFDMDGIREVDSSTRKNTVTTAEENITSIDNCLIPIPEDLPLKIQMNALQPVSKLPEEIILRIFVLLIAANDCAPPYNYWCILTQICQYWRNIALGCSEIWSKIQYTGDGNKNILRLFLERSKTTEIDVTFLRPDNRAIGIDVIELLRGHMQRVRSLSISTSADVSYQNLIQQLLEESGQCLKSLSLQAVRSRTLSLNPIQPIHLDELDIKNVSLPWNNSILRGLSSLIISNIKDIHVQPTLVEFLDILEACPMLRDLQLDKIRLEASENVETLGRRSIKLSRLENLRIYGINYSAYSFLANSIIAPKDVAWKVHCDNFPARDARNFIPNFPERAMQCKSFNIRFARDSLKFISEKSVIPVTSLSFNWGAITYSRRLTNLLISMTETLIGQTYWNNPTEISFVVYIATNKSRNEMQKSFWLRILALIPHIRSLNVTFVFGREDPDICNAKGFIDALAEPRNHDLQSTSWYCSNLENLELVSASFITEEGRHAFRKLTDHFQHRRQQGFGLHTLRFSSCSRVEKEDEDELKRLDIAGEIKFSDK